MTILYHEVIYGTCITYIWIDFDIRARWATICWLFARVFLRIESEQNFVNFGSNITTSYLFAILNMTRRVILTILYLNILKQNFLTTLCRNRGILPRLLQKRYPQFFQKNQFLGTKYWGKKISMEILFLDI